MPGARQVVVVVPVFNEAEGVATLIERWLRATADVDAALHLYDDGSNDGTAAILERAARDQPRVHIHHHANRGHGPTLARAYAEHAGAEWILQIDADDVIGPGLFAEWWPHRASHDLWLASRVDHDRSRLRRTLTHMARATVRLRYGRGIRDVNAPYRLIRGAALGDLLASLAPETLLPNVLVSGAACARGLRVHQSTVTVAGRQRPEPWASKLRWLRLGVRGGLQLLRPLPGRRDA
jgi:glycosyltransferase involved in cell wall biosynthesis